MSFAIVTGVSKGFGAAIAELLLEAGIHVMGISRTENDRLCKVAKDYNRIYKHYACDLTKLHEVEKTIDQMLDEIFENEPPTLYLINNAAIVQPVNQAMNIDESELISHMHINTIAPMIMTNKCLKKVHDSNTYFIAVQLTSGAAEAPVYGWSSYCSSKASLSMYTKTVALEQEKLDTGNKIIAFDPGIMDTKMQEVIRSSSHEAFKDLERFKQYKENNLLQDPANVAGILVDLLTDEVNLENGKIYKASEFF